MATRTLPSQTYLRQCFDYDADTGILTWRERPREHFKSAQAHAVHRRCHAGNAAGCPNGFGYLVVGLNGQNWLVHRIVWCLAKGQTDQQIDHVNGQRSDNRLANLRQCTSQQNNWNAVSRSTSATGLKGVSRNSHTGWQARLASNGKTHCLGTFPSQQEAHDAYLAKARELHGAFFKEP